MTETYYDIPTVLNAIDPAACDYDEWTSIGMALKAGGFPCSMWDSWSRRDAARYHEGECERKWESFKGGWSASVNIGTIIHIAESQGWEPPARAISGNRVLDWNDAISDELKVIDTRWLEGQELHEPVEWDPAGELIRYLQTLFESSENVGYVTKAWKPEGGEYMPSAGSWDRTAGQLIQELSNCGGDIGAVLGDYKEEVGAWIRFNPLDGKGIKNENVTDFRYALVESDSTPIDQQNAIIRELELPVACLVHSGKKSLHAIVRIEAGSYEEYKKRVEYLYSVCKKNGLEIDQKNRNPSRLSRMPGVIRNGHKQWLVDTNIGQPSWSEWKEWIEGVNDELPDFEDLAGALSDLPPLDPPLIEGVLRQGQKMLLVGPSKAGKSYALMQLAIAIAEGGYWLGWKCTQGKVLYVNLEIAKATCYNRFAEIYKAMRKAPAHADNIRIWNLRGKSVPMDKLAPKLIRRAIKECFIAVIIDPIYKIITGDENSAAEMAVFCNQFDKVCDKLNCAVIYCHHHSKGVQSYKRSMDRASGSGVFARDPDALLDLIELNVTDALREQETNKALCSYWDGRLEDAGFPDAASQDQLCSSVTMQGIAQSKLSQFDFQTALTGADKVKDTVSHYAAWRIEGTLREFPSFKPLYLWFKYPIHIVDNSGSLNDLHEEDTVWGNKGKKKKVNKGQSSKEPSAKEKVDNAYEILSLDGDVTLEKLAEYWECTEKAVDSRLKRAGGYSIRQGVVTRKDG